MARSTYQTYLMKGTGTTTVTYSKLIDIKEFPDLIAPPDRLETTTLSDAARTYIEGLQDTDEMTFTANYDPTDFQTIQALKGTEQNLAVWFGATTSGSTETPDGSAGKFTFKGYVSASINGGGVNEVVDMTITVTPTTVITPTFS